MYGGTRSDWRSIGSIWKLLNTPLAMVIISTLIIGGAGRLILNEQENVKRDTQDRQRLRQLIVEYYNRGLIVEKYTGGAISGLMVQAAYDGPDSAIGDYIRTCLGVYHMTLIPGMFGKVSKQEMLDMPAAIDSLIQETTEALNGSSPYHPTRPEFVGVSISSVMDQIEELDHAKWSGYHLVSAPPNVIKLTNIPATYIHIYTPVQVAYSGLFPEGKFTNPCEAISRARQLLLYGRALTDKNVFSFDNDTLDPSISELRMMKKIPRVTGYATARLADLDRPPYR
jgi:hypothetical protein